LGIVAGYAEGVVDKTTWLFLQQQKPDAVHWLRFLFHRHIFRFRQCSGEGHSAVSLRWGFIHQPQFRLRLNQKPTLMMLKLIRQSRHSQ
jgi:hypothetical protein